jgi:serine/threonine protein kinase
MADRVGQQLGNYRLVRSLGKGGFGEVYLAEHIFLKTPAAIKVLHTQVVDEDLNSFLKEAQTIAGLDHPSIVRVLDFGIEGATPYLVMSYAANGTLRQRHPTGSHLSLDMALSYARQVAAALHYAHSRKLIHRDIKPENMLLGANNEVLLSDFGIALVAQSSRLQSTKEVVGTVAYMAPEQLQGKPRPASDQYALGIVLYEWLSGERPFHGTFVELYSQHMFVPPPSLSQKLPTLSPDIEQVMMRALAKDPQQRFESVTAFVTALEEASIPTQQASKPLTPLPGTAGPPQLSSSPTLAAAPRGIVSPQTPLPPGPAMFQTPGPVQPISTPGVFPSDPDPETPGKRGISRRLMLAGVSSAVALIALGGAGLAWFTLTQGSHNKLVQSGSPAASNSPFSSSPAASPTSTHSPRPTATKTPVRNTPTPQTTPQPTQPPTPHPTTQPTQPPTPPPPQGTTLYTFTGQKYGIRELRWSPNSNRIVSAANDHTARVWGATDGSNVVTYSGHSNYVEGVAWSPDGSRIASGSADTTVQIWDPNTAAHYYTYIGHKLWVNRVSWSPNGQYIVSGEQASKVGYVVQARVWEPYSGNTLVIYSGHTNGIFSVAWSPDGSRIASCGYDGTLQIWDALTGNRIATFNPAVYLFGLSWSPDSTHIVIGGNQANFWVIDAATGNVSATYNSNANAVVDVGWSPDGTRIVAGTGNQGAQIYDYASGARMYSYSQSGSLDGIGWSSNSQMVASGDGDLTSAIIQVWEA